VDELLSELQAQNAALLDQIKHQVLHDALTGLPNPLLFE
jgi:GGDEF domain-containing protein